MIRGPYCHQCSEICRLKREDASDCMSRIEDAGCQRVDLFQCDGPIGFHQIRRGVDTAIGERVSPALRQIGDPVGVEFEGRNFLAFGGVNQIGGNTLLTDRLQNGTNFVE